MKLLEPVFEPEPTKHEVDSLGTRLQLQRRISHYRLYINIVRIWLCLCLLRRSMSSDIYGSG